MKPKKRTSEWLAAARRHAGLTQVELAKLAGLKSTIIMSLYETGSQLPATSTWEVLEDVLRPLVPLMFVDEEALISAVEAGVCWEKEGALCRLAYVPNKHGIAFVDVKPAQGEPLEGSFITVPLTEALGLLRQQRTWFDDSSDSFTETREDRPESRAGEEFRKMREALGLGQRDVARMLSTSQPAISLLERGLEKRPDLAKRYRQLLEQLTEEAQTE